MRSMFLVLCGLLLSVAASADDHWLVFTSGPFQVLTNAGDKPGREAMNYLEQLRYTLGTTLGKTELTTLWPVQIVITKSTGGTAVYPEMKLARDNYVASVPALGPETVAGLTRILIDSNAGRMPVGVENGLIELFSTLDVDGTRVTLGVKPAQPDRDWSRVHMLSVEPVYSGKLRVLLGNLQQGVDAEPAYRNAFERTQQQIETQLNSYIEAGKYGTVGLSGKPIDVKRQLYAKTPDAAAVELARADLLFANGDSKAAAAYRALAGGSPESSEGLGLIALKQNKTAEARTHLEAATKAGSKSARVWFEWSRLTADAAQKRAALAKAAELNPRWSVPIVELASLETQPLGKVAVLKKAAGVSARDSAYWHLLAETQEAAAQFPDAAKSWAMADRAAQDSQEREAIHQARLVNQQKRLDREEADKREAARKAEQELNDLRNKALTDIRAFEAKANAGQKPLDSNAKLGEYQETSKPQKVSGVLLQVDCIDQRARLRIQTTEKKPVQILVPDPMKVVIHGGKDLSLDCGPQKPAREVTVEYYPRADRKLGTLGDVISIQYY
jgi:hypothetical protein